MLASYSLRYDLDRCFGITNENYKIRSNVAHRPAPTSTTTDDDASTVSGMIGILCGSIHGVGVDGPFISLVGLVK